MRNTLISGIIGLVVGCIAGVAAAPYLRLGATWTAVSAATPREIVTIGTGGVTGVYYPAGGAICLLVNKDRRRHGLRCSVESTGGSIYNLRTIRAGELDMGVAQSDWQFHAYKGTANFADVGPLTKLRSVFSLYSEAFTVVARANAGIRAFNDLKGKRVNIGNLGSGHRATMEVVMKSMGWTMATFGGVSELRSADQSAALCGGKIDAMVFTVGHPSQSIKEATTACDSNIVTVAGPAIDKLVADNEYYTYVNIPGGMYRGNPNDVMTFGVAATLVTSAATPDDTVYTVVKAVFENFDTFKSLHPAFKDLKMKDMIKQGLTAPLHDGAVRYYREAGLM